jgi:hypothetical protein
VSGWRVAGRVDHDDAAFADDQPEVTRRHQPDFVGWLVIAVVIYASVLAASVLLTAVHVAALSAFALMMGLPTWLLLAFLGWRYRQPKSERSVARFRILAIGLAFLVPSAWLIATGFFIGGAWVPFVVAGHSAFALLIPLPLGGFRDPTRRMRRQ